MEHDVPIRVILRVANRRGKRDALRRVVDADHLAVPLVLAQRKQQMPIACSQIQEPRRVVVVPVVLFVYVALVAEVFKEG